MATLRTSTAHLDSLQGELERIEGDLDAALVFAASAKEALRRGDSQLGGAAISDAQECFEGVVSTLSRINAGLRALSGL